MVLAPPPNRPLTAPVRAPEIPIRAFFTGVASFEYVSGGPTSPWLPLWGSCRRSRLRGEIAEAPPVADEARRFRGSAPAIGRDSGREPAGTTVGRKQKPLQPSQSPSVTALPEGEPSRGRRPRRAASARQVRGGGHFPIQSVIFFRNYTKCSAPGHQESCRAGPGRGISAPPRPVSYQNLLKSLKSFL